MKSSYYYLGGLLFIIKLEKRDDDDDNFDYTILSAIKPNIRQILNIIYHIKSSLLVS